MFEHLLSPEFDDVTLAPPMEIVGAQANTLSWLEQLGEEDAKKEIPGAADLARNAFTAVTSTAVTEEEQRRKVMTLRAPPAVRHLVGLLGAYDWDFVEQAKQLRGYAVAQIVEETKHPDARIRLKALDMLGKVTEVGLYTEKVEITHVQTSTAELEASIRERLSKYLPKVEDITDVPDALEAPTSAQTNA